MPLLEGRETRYPPRDFLYWEQGSAAHNMQSVLLDERFFAYRMKPGEQVRAFDVFDDPGCKQDLTSKRPELVKRAEKLFISNRTENPWYVGLTTAIEQENPVRIPTEP